MTDLGWLRGLADWAGQHPVVLCLLVSVACVVGLVVGTACTSAHDGDTEADKAIRQRVAANREKRARRVESNCPDVDDEHGVWIGI